MRSSTAFLGGRRLRDRLFERGLSIGAVSPSITEKPLPCDPGLPVTTAMPPLPKQADPRRMVQKSVPNLRAARPFDPNSQRTKSVNGFLGNTNAVASISNLGRSSSRFSKAKINPKLDDRQNKGAGVVPPRPATAPSRTLRARSTSFEQLKALCKCRKDEQRNVAVQQTPSQPRRPLTAQASTRGETMKEQLLQYIKGDRVMDAWEGRPQEEKYESRNSQKKGDLRSRFRAKSTNPPGTSEGQPANILDDDLERQMAWLQEGTEALNTYSLKPRREVAPRIHALSVHMDLTQDLEGDVDCRHQDDSGEGDAHSIITALPSVPRPPVR